MQAEIGNAPAASSRRRGPYKIAEPDHEFLRDNGLITRKQFCRLVGLKEQRALQLEHEGVFHVRRLGRLRLYKLEEVKTWLTGDQPVPAGKKRSPKSAD